MSWFAKYPGLIGSMNLCSYPDAAADPADSAAVLHAIRQLAEFGLQTAAAAAALGSGAPLRLRSYTSSMPATAGFPAAMPAATLTRLKLENSGKGTWFPPLGKLTNLQEVSVSLRKDNRTVVDSCLRQIGTLQKLTYLALTCESGNMRLLPLSLKRLSLSSFPSSAQSDHPNEPSMDLQHLVKVQQLRVGSSTSLAEGSSLPPSLQNLEVIAPLPAGGLIGWDSLHQVTSIDISTSRVRGQHLRKLENLSQLRSLSLVLYSLENLSSVAASWHSIPLRKLEIVVGSLTASELTQVVQHVSVATQLTRVSIRADITGGAAPYSVSVCEHFGLLCNLESLKLCVGVRKHFAKQNTEQLSALVKLTELSLAYDRAGPYVDPTVVCLLAVTLTNLRVLAINEFDVPDDDTGGCINESVLPAIGRLTQLEALRLEPLEQDVAVRGLGLLTGLSRLTELEGFDQAGDEALDTFWNHILLQQQGDLTVCVANSSA